MFLRNSYFWMKNITSGVGCVNKCQELFEWPLILFSCFSIYLIFILRCRCFIVLVPVSDSYLLLCVAFLSLHGTLVFRRLKYNPPPSPPPPPPPLLRPAQVDTLINTWEGRTPWVNFTNILRAAFFTKVLFAAFL